MKSVFLSLFWASGLKRRSIWIFHTNLLLLFLSHCPAPVSVPLPCTPSLAPLALVTLPHSLLSLIVDSPRLASPSDPHTLQTAADGLCRILYVTLAAPSLLGARVGCRVKERRAEVSRPVFAGAPWGSLSENAVVSYEPLCLSRKTMVTSELEQQHRGPFITSTQPWFWNGRSSPLSTSGYFDSHRPNRPRSPILPRAVWHLTIITFT